jgi:AraC-like DNA-binding protein
MIERSANDQIFIRKLTEIILANLGNGNFGAKEFAQESGMSSSGLNRRLRKIINKNINQFIREIRLNKALEMLQNEDVSASEVSYKVGFSNPTYFNTCFHEFFGYPPGEVKKVDFNIKEEINPVQVVAKKEEKRTAWRTIILSSSSTLFLVVLSYLVYSIFFKNSSTNEGNLVRGPEKSVAVLPFENLSDTSANKYFIDGVMEEILTNLSRIHDLRDATF